MDVRVEEDGTVKVLKVTHGLPMLISSSVQAVSQWLYEPYRVNGVATPVDTTITLEFRFDKKMLWAVVAPPQPGLMVPSPVVAPALPPPPEGVMRISGHVMAAMLEKRVDPVYPVGSIALDARGTVVLLATVDKSGAVCDVQVISGPSRFRAAAVDAVKQWRYSPYLVEGDPAMVQTPVTLDFAPPH
jgi:TonB family protein